MTYLNLQGQQSKAPASQDIHKGFQDIDQTAEVEDFLRFLDEADGLASVQAYRQQMLELCPPTAGQQILDVGCGVGHSALRLASLVGPTGRVVGLDKSGLFIAEAQRRAVGQALPLVYQVGDVQQMEFPAHAFDVCRTERVLMYVDQPQQALDEMLRVVRPGGALLCFELDYEGMIVDAPDQAFTRCLGRLLADSAPSPWIARQLPRLFRERGLQAITVIPHMILTPYAMYQRVAGGTLAQAVYTGQLSAGAVEAWWRDLEQAEAAGHFFAGFLGFLVCGHIPCC